MKRNTLILLICGLFPSAPALFAAPPEKEGPWRNEDLRYIRQWERDRKLADMAAQLQLTPEQVATLRSIKSQIAQIDAELEPRIAESKAALETAAKAIRARLENDGSLTEADREQLRAYGDELRQIRRERRMRAKEAAQGLEGFLTEAQRQTLLAFRMAEGHNKHAQHEGKAKPRGTGEKSRKIREKIGERMRDKHGERLARLLLSDAFLNSLP